MSRKVILVGLAVLAVFWLGLLFRFYDIQDFPPGLFPDEAANGEDALLILEGDSRAFYPRGNGREALFFYLEAASIWLFGVGYWQLHVVSALIGTVTVLAMYFAVRPWFGRLAGLMAMLLLATNHWHVTMSRTGFRAILIPLFVALFTAWVGYMILAVKEGKRGRSYFYAALAGAAFAGGFYTYIAYRVMIGVAGGVFFILLLAALHPRIGFPHFKRYGKQTVVAVIAGALVLLPLLLYFIAEPQDFVGRAGQVSVFNRELQEEFGGGTLAGTLLYSTRETLVSFFAGDGDLNWRHNVAGWPLLNPIVGVLYLVGLAWAIRGFVMLIWKLVRGQEVHLGMIYPYLLLMLAGMLLPVITTAEGMPHGLRSIGLVLPIFMLAGAAGAVVIRWCQRRFAASPLKGACLGVIAGLLIVGVLYDGTLYFLVARNDSEAYYYYRADLIEVVEYIKDYTAANPGERPYLVLDKFSLQTPHFLLSVQSHEFTGPDERHPEEDHHLYRSVEPEDSHLQELLPGEIMIFTDSSLFDTTRYEEQHANIEVIESRENRFGQEIMRVYRGTTPLEREVDDIEVEGFGLDA